VRPSTTLVSMTVMVTQLVVVVEADLLAAD
jgi:hypothetical protein